MADNNFKRHDRALCGKANHVFLQESERRFRQNEWCCESFHKKLLPKLRVLENIFQSFELLVD